MVFSLWWFLSPEIVFGEDALDYLEQIKGRRAFIVTDKTICGLGFVDIVVAKLRKAGMEVQVFDGVEREPSVENVSKGAETLTQFAPDWIIGLGGGSCIDAAKAMWVLYENPNLRVEEINPMTELTLRQKAKLVAIPTTSGTGSEATWAAVITEPKERRKMELPSKQLIADIAILDPALPTLMPPELTADTGMDALAHAVEAFASTWSTDFTDALALKAIKLVFENLAKACSNRKDRQVRERMHNAATLAGMAFSNSQLGVAHAMAHSLGGVLKLPHGKTVGMMLPYVIRFSRKEAAERYADILQNLGVSTGPGEDSADVLASTVERLMRQIGETLSLEEWGIGREIFTNALDLLVERACESTLPALSPRVPSEAEVRKLFEYAYEGRRVDF